MTDKTDSTATSRHGSVEGAEARRRAARGTRGRSRGTGLLERLRSSPAATRRALVIAGAIAAFAVVSAGVDLAVSADRVHPGVSVSGVPVGGLSKVEAASRLRSKMPARLARPVKAAFGATSWTVHAKDVGAAVDASRSADGAFAVGRDGGFWTAVGSRLGAVFGGVDVPAAMTGDPEKLSDLLDGMDDRIATDPVDARIAVTGTTPRLVPSKPGRQVRRVVVTRELLAALAARTGSIRVTVEVLPARVGDADARQALADARMMLSGPAQVTWETRSWTFEPATIAGWMEFRSVAATSTGGASAAASSGPAAEGSSGLAVAATDRMVLQAGLDSAEVSSTLLPLLGTIGRPAVEARFVVEGGRVTVSGGQVGLGPDFKGLATDLERALRGTKARSAALRLTTIEPLLTAQKARDMGIVERISTYSTTYAASAKDRVNNIHTLADALNDKLVPPGGVFDFNQTVGERTAAKGYREAPAIVNGKLVPQLGGGICQIGTTFFNAVFFSGLPVIERKNHSFYISHYPTGRDCTITWGGPNLRWRNETSTWILIKTAYTNSSVTISLYGTSPGYSVSYTTSPFENIRPHPVVEVKDPTLPIGARIVEDGGVDGAKVTVVRTVTKGGQVVRTDTFLSLYKPKEETVRVGTKAGSTPTTGTP